MDKATIILDFLVEPRDFANIDDNIKNQIVQKQNKYIDEIGAILIKYKKHKVISKNVKLLYNRPQICLKVKIGCNVLTPRVGIVVPARVIYVNAHRTICIAYNIVKIEVADCKSKKGDDVNVKITGLGKNAFSGTIVNEI